MRFTLLSRAYCDLCDEMEAALRLIIGATPLVVVDVDAPEHAALAARYDEAVPVLFAGDPASGREVCRHRVDAASVSAALSETPEIR